MPFGQPRTTRLLPNGCPKAASALRHERFAPVAPSEAAATLSGPLLDPGFDFHKFGAAEKVGFKPNLPRRIFVVVLCSEAG